jgi:hypothetical protein
VDPTLFSESSDERVERVEIHGLAHDITKACPTRPRPMILKRCRSDQRGRYRATVFWRQAAYSTQKLVPVASGHGEVCDEDVWRYSPHLPHRFRSRCRCRCRCAAVVKYVSDDSSRILVVIHEKHSDALQTAAVHKGINVHTARQPRRRSLCAEVPFYLDDPTVFSRRSYGVVVRSRL